MNLYPYLRAILADWQSLVSGIMSVVLLFLGATVFWKKPTPRWIVLMLALVCFITASYRVWNAEHIANADLQHAKADLQQRLEFLTVPQLVGSFGSMNAIPAGGGIKGVVFTGNFDIKNWGAPSVADRFSLTLVTPDRVIVGIDIPTQQPRVWFKAKINEESGEVEGTPIPPGSYYLPLYKDVVIERNGQISGYLTVAFSDITVEDVFRPENRLRLTFVDAKEKPYSFEHALTRTPTAINGSSARRARGSSSR